MIILPYSGIAGPTSFAYDDPVATAQLSYAGTWAHNTSVTNTYQTTESVSSTLNSTVTVTPPLGTTQIKWIATKTLASGQANVSVDGGAATPVDLYNASTSYQQTVFTSGALAAGTQHTLTITVLATKSHAGVGTGTNISIDEFTGTIAASFSQGPLLATAPHVIITDTGCASNKDYPPTQVPTATHGALANPGLPYGTFNVCVDDGTNHVTFLAVPNTSFASPTAASTTTNQWIIANIYAGGGGTAGSGASVINGTYATGVCT